MYGSDAFGDSLSVAEQIERERIMLEDFYRASVHHTSKLRQPAESDFDDLVQEGVVAAWKATQVERTDPTTYGAVSARRRISSVVTGKRAMVGNENPGSKTYDMARRNTNREDFAVLNELPSKGDPFVAVEQRIDMKAAIQTLEPRDRKIAVLVGLDRTWEDIGDEVGLAPISARNRWTRTVRPALREALAAVA